MLEYIVFLDESGDLGWKFHQPYRAGGSSRYLTISAIMVPFGKSYHLSRTIKNLYTAHQWETKKEKKWAHMKPDEKLYFAKALVDLTNKHHEIKLLSITVYKPNVREHIRKDPNKLYNYMIGLMLLNEIKNLDRVIFTPDPRNIKVECGNSLHDYLVTKLWFDLSAKTQLINQPQDSSSNKGVQFTDMFSGLIQQYFEDNKSELFNLLPAYRISPKRLYFGDDPAVSTKSEVSDLANKELEPWEENILS